MVQFGQIRRKNRERVFQMRFGVVHWWIKVIGTVSTLSVRKFRLGILLYLSRNPVFPGRFPFGKKKVVFSFTFHPPHTSRFFVGRHKNLRLSASARQIVLIHRTLADKARQDILKFSTAGYCPTMPDLVVDLSEFTAH